MSGRGRAWSRPLRQGLKRLRDSQPFNWVATGLVRAALSPLAARPELVVRHLHRVGPVSSKLPDGRRLRLSSQADDWVSNQVYWRGWTGYEPETAPLFYELATRSRVTLDVGAYVGFFTLLAAHANPGGRVLAFEPLPQAFSRLRANIERNGLANAVALPFAAGAEDGQADFFHIGAAAVRELASDGRNSIPCSSSLSADFMRGVAGVVRLPVQVRRLDSLLAGERIDAVDLVKIDTESTEPDVIRGMRAALAVSRPAIVCEVLAGAGTGPCLSELLAPLGYRAFLLTPDGPQPRETVDGHPQWLNYLFTPSSPPEVAALHRRACERAGLRPR